MAAQVFHGLLLLRQKAEGFCLPQGHFPRGGKGQLPAEKIDGDGAEKFRRRFQKVTAVQAALAADGSAKGRPLKTALRSFSVMLSWSLESAIVTADSMKSRGYGTAKRTAMARFRFTRRDRILTLWLLLCGVSLVGAAATGAFDWRYFPALGGADLTPVAGYLLALYFLFCMTPLWADCCLT